jgi:hypothetical protein
VPLEGKRNQYLTADKGWLTGQPDRGHFPAGENKFAGVTIKATDVAYDAQVGSQYGVPAALAITAAAAE